MKRLSLLITGLLLIGCAGTTQGYPPSTFDTTELTWTEVHYSDLATPEATPVPPSPSPSPSPTPTPTPKPTSKPVVTGKWIKDPEVSWYGPGFYGRRTACGLAYTKTILGVAHRSLPCGTKVTFMWKGKSVTVPVIDRGPYVRGRTWDLSGGLCVYLNHCFTGPIYYRLGK